MKAVIYQNYGPPEVLELTELSKPNPKDNEVLIRVQAVEVTKSDCEMRSFKFPVTWFWLPLRLVVGLRKPKKQILGSYFAGEVEVTGKSVSKFQAGDQVFGSTGFHMGAYAEYMCLPEGASMALKPENMSFEQAAAVPLGGLNAIHFLTRAKIREGEHVLINGAGGSIGTFAVQIAKTLGAEVSAVDSAHKEDMLRKIGVDHFIDYRQQDFTQKTQTYDVILSMVAQTSFAGCMNALKAKGRYLMANPRLSDMLRSMSAKAMGKTATFAFAGESKAELLSLREMIEAGKISSVIDEIFPMSKIAQAHRRVETEQRLGCVVIKNEVYEA